MNSELPISPTIVEAFVLNTGGTILCARTALERGACMNIGGGLHHAFPDHAEGFCYLHDVAVATRLLTREGRIGRAVTIDLDLHQGNGTAAIFAVDPDVFTFSMHQENLYPEKMRSDLDIGLADFTDGETYLALLDKHLPGVLDDHRPDLAFYLAGADPFEEDKLGNLRLSKEALAARDRFVFAACESRNIPVAVVLAGGYAPSVEDTADIHYNTATAMLEMNVTTGLKLE